MANPKPAGRDDRSRHVATTRSTRHAVGGSGQSDGRPVIDSSGRQGSPGVRRHPHSPSTNSRGGLPPELKLARLRRMNTLRLAEVSRSVARSLNADWLKLHGKSPHVEPLDPESQQQILDWFQLVDEDGSRTLDCHELLEALKAAGVPADEATMAEMIGMMDYNHDGRIGLDEFSAFMTHELRHGKALEDGEYVLPSGQSLNFGMMLAKLKRLRMMHEVQDPMRRKPWLRVAKDERELARFLAQQSLHHHMHRQPAMQRPATVAAPAAGPAASASAASAAEFNFGGLYLHTCRTATAAAPFSCASACPSPGGRGYSHDYSPQALGHEGSCGQQHPQQQQGQASGSADHPSARTMIGEQMLASLDVLGRNQPRGRSRAGASIAALAATAEAAADATADAAGAVQGRGPSNSSGSSGGIWPPAQGPAGLPGLAATMTMDPDGSVLQRTRLLMTCAVPGRQGGMQGQQGGVQGQGHGQQLQQQGHEEGLQLPRGTAQSAETLPSPATVASPAVASPATARCSLPGGLDRDVSFGSVVMDAEQVYDGQQPRGLNPDPDLGTERSTASQLWDVPLVLPSAPVTTASATTAKATAPLDFRTESSAPFESMSPREGGSGSHSGGGSRSSSSQGLPTLMDPSHLSNPRQRQQHPQQHSPSPSSGSSASPSLNPSTGSLGSRPCSPSSHRPWTQHHDHHYHHRPQQQQQQSAPPSATRFMGLRPCTSTSSYMMGGGPPSCLVGGREARGQATAWLMSSDRCYSPQQRMRKISSTARAIQQMFGEEDGNELLHKWWPEEMVRVSATATPTSRLQSPWRLSRTGDAVGTVHPAGLAANRSSSHPYCAGNEFGEPDENLAPEDSNLSSDLHQKFLRVNGRSGDGDGGPLLCRQPRESTSSSLPPNQPQQDVQTGHVQGTKDYGHACRGQSSQPQSPLHQAPCQQHPEPPAARPLVSGAAQSATHLGRELLQLHNHRQVMQALRGGAAAPPAANAQQWRTSEAAVATGGPPQHGNISGAGGYIRPPPEVSLPKAVQDLKSVWSLYDSDMSTFAANAVPWGVAGRPGRPSPKVVALLRRQGGGGDGEGRYKMTPLGSASMTPRTVAQLASLDV